MMEHDAVSEQALIAYFSMEVALDNHIPTFSGGLGVLAGDTLRSAADLGLPMVGVTLLYRKGYFFQRLDPEGRQHEEPVAWPVDDLLQPADGTCASSWRAGQSPYGPGDIRWPGRAARRCPWCYSTPAFPTTIPMIAGAPTTCTAVRVRMLRALGYSRVVRFHMDEGHSSLLALALFAEELERTPAGRDAATERTKARCIFTTHTPVPARHERFPLERRRTQLGAARVNVLQALGCCDTELDMTRVALT